MPVSVAFIAGIVERPAPADKGGAGNEPPGGNDGNHRWTQINTDPEALFDSENTEGDESLFC